MTTNELAVPHAGRSGRVVRLILGDDVPRALWPILVISLMSATTFTGVWGYIGVWAVTALHASSGATGTMFLIYSMISAGTGWTGGALSDRIGRRNVMITGWSTASILILCLPLCAGNPALGMSVAVLAMATGSPATVASFAVVGDLAGEDTKERAYAAARVMSNVGSILGPPLAGLLLLGENWSLFFLVFGVLGAITVTMVALLLSRTSASAAKPATTGPAAHQRGALMSRGFLLLLASTLLGYFSYVAFVAVLPVTAVADYHLPSSAWGLIFAVNPILVVLLQMRVTRAIVAVRMDRKLALATLLMGLPFLLLLALPNVVGIVLVTSLFVFGEMAWAPSVEGLVVTMAPPEERGRAFGAYRGVGQAAMGLGPFVLFNLRSVGLHWVWPVVGAIALLGAAAGMLAARGWRGESYNSPGSRSEGIQ